MINVLIVDDSATELAYLKHIINSEPDLNVVGVATDGVEAVRGVNRWRPNVVLMDIHMPRMDGYQATCEILKIYPVPVIIMSARTGREQATKTFRSMQVGAVAALEKPVGPDHIDSAQAIEKFVQTVRLMSEIKVVKRPVRSRRISNSGKSKTPGLHSALAKVELVVMAASTGGPPVICHILSRLRNCVSPPILIVQHIARGFLEGFSKWLEREAGLPVKAAMDGERIRKGQIYLAPDDYHMGVTSKRTIALSKAPPENRLRPSASYLFRSVGEAYGPRAVGVLLTGMGKDGAMELKEMQAKGAITIAQSKETSLVHGMPGEAIRLGGAEYILSPAEISLLLEALNKENQIKAIETQFRV
jgi:two-component system chemotaxis response regulator CheB